MDLFRELEISFRNLGITRGVVANVLKKRANTSAASLSNGIYLFVTHFLVSNIFHYFVSHSYPMVQHYRTIFCEITGSQIFFTFGPHSYHSKLVFATAKFQFCAVLYLVFMTVHWSP